MSETTVGTGPLELGHEALLRGDWAEARAAFEEAAAVDGSPEALDGLGRALWWLRDGEGAIVARERAYAGFRREGVLARAARIALWLSREYALVYENHSASRGWLARAERLLADAAPGAERGWLDLARSERSRDPADAAALAESALDVALATGDRDLELRALAQSGLAEISRGHVDEGLERLDEAMAAVTGGEPASLETFSDVYCTLLHGCELAGESERPREWSQVLEAFAREVDYLPLLAFCRSCCADVHASRGRIDESESELVAALAELESAGQRARCVHPATRLATIRVHQGRLEDAEQLLAGLAGAPEAVEASVQLRLAAGEPQAAAAVLERRLDEVGRDSLLAAPLLARLVEAQLALGENGAARDASEQLAVLADVPGRDRIEAMAMLARGRCEAAMADPAAPDTLRSAVNGFAALGLRLDAARARLDLAGTLAQGSPELAIEVAKRARTELESLGADREADQAAALMRSLGAKGRAGPRATGDLSKRELEVVRLLAEGLTNADIGRRLFISPKTAEHHVARIRAKLDLRSRSEAAAWAVRNLKAD